jgi:hypothetical protein
MNFSHQTGYAAAVVLAAGGMLIGYFVPVVGVIAMILIVCLVIASLLDAAFIFEAALAPLRSLWRWLAQKDDSRWVRRAPFIGLIAGWLFRWAASGLAAQGGA